MNESDLLDALQQRAAATGLCPMCQRALGMQAHDVGNGSVAVWCIENGGVLVEASVEGGFVRSARSHANVPADVALEILRSLSAVVESAGAAKH